MKERTAYQKQMDQIRLPDQKKEETLRLLLAENRKLREKDAARASASGPVPVRKTQKKWIPAAALAAAAACLVLAAVGLSGRGGYSFESIRLRSLPQVGARGGEAQKLSFQEAFGRSPESLFAAGQVTEGETETVFLEEQLRHRASLDILTDGKTLGASVTDYEPPVYGAIGKTQEMNGVQVRLAEDTEIGRKCCVYSRDGLYVLLYSDTLSRKDFADAVRTAVRK